MMDIYAVAQGLIEELRTNLGELRRSPDAQARLQRAALRKVERSGRRRRSLCPGIKNPVEKLSFCFVPLATEPTLGVEFSTSFVGCAEEVASAESYGDLGSVPATAGARSSSRSGVAQGKPSRSTALQSTDTTAGVVLTARQNTRSSRFPIAAKEQHPPAHTPARDSKGAAFSVGPGKDDGAAAAIIVSSEAHTDPSTTSLRVPFSGTSRALFDLRRLSPLAQQLYVDMQRRAAAALPASTSGDWRRRTMGSQDAEVRRAVRDYLYRMNIISVMEVKDTSAAPPHVFSDAVLNGTALCQLIASLREGGEPLSCDPVPCRCPRTLDEVRVNYAAALAALRGTPDAAQELVPRTAWMMLPEEVYLRASPTALLSLLVHLISTYLPAPEELPLWRQHMCWQPPANTSNYAPISPTELATAEAECGRFLHEWGVLPDHTIYRLPGDECLLPAATASPYMARWSGYVVRSEPPSSITVPSVWPFLCNGVLLVLLARRSSMEAAEKAAALSSTTGQPFFSNPRTWACCAANIASAFRSFQAAATNKLPLSFVSEESVAAVMRGDRVHILRLLLHLRAAVKGRALSLHMCSPLVSKAATVQAGRTAPEVSVCAPNAGSLVASSSSSSSPIPVAQPPFSVSKSGFCPSVLPSPIPRSVSPRPFATLTSASSALLRHEVMSAEEPKDCGGLCGWLRHQIGISYRYTAADESFVFDAATFTLQQPCLLFSDGVVLAYLIGRLERCRCSFLDCVRPTSKRAMKLFNVRRCLEFLRSTAGIVFDVALLDEALMEGKVEGVVSVLQAMRHHYCLARAQRTPLRDVV
ncbi:hypothetical protein JKF63_00023 [Porcisia hertigi]|uniref:Uncharacterized protein n=1 Tax=Porcisia hertigi TaxID=2761500 RepID=A0A836KWQ0_9TRYP|nr:hypothetical protein JKF63_00023 [Porcisia hertigi]